MRGEILIVYFSGTGGTKRIANAFREDFESRDYRVNTLSLDNSETEESSQHQEEILKPCGLVILVFPIYALNAPQPVYDWIEGVNIKNKKVAVISVSGGGEAWPNKGCRNRCCKALEDRGFLVAYEKMMVMPSNWVFAVNDHLAMHLLKAVPEKVSKIADNLVKGKVRRTNHRQGFLSSCLSKFEKKSSYEFAKKLIITEECKGCGWCKRSCPVRNIDLRENRPCFLNKCIMCFRCVYGCPFKAIKSRNFMVIKNGFDLDELEKRMEGTELKPVLECCKGLLWIGVKNYLLDKDGF